MSTPTRYAPDQPFPAYAFVPGQHPHPVTDPKGHSYGSTEEELASPAPSTLASNRRFRYAVDLFNHGYYWEAHEAWEGLWHAAGRKGNLAEFLKGLIRLAAAGVKAREGNRAGVIRHAERARALFSQTGCMKLVPVAEQLITQPPVDAAFTVSGNPVLELVLNIEDFQVPLNP